MLEIVLKSKIEQEDEDDWIKLWRRSKQSHFFNSPYWYNACSNGLLQKISIWFVYDNIAIKMPPATVKGSIFETPFMRCL